jgi:hypothetical protein
MLVADFLCANAVASAATRPIARLIQKAYLVDPLECVNCGSNMRIIALIDKALL